MLELIATTLGVGVCKGLLSTWVDDEAVLGKTGEAALDFAKTKLDHFSQQRDLERQFDSISDKVAEHIAPIIERDFSDLDDKELQIVLNAAKQTLEHVPLSRALVMEEMKAQPRNLFKYLSTRTGSEGGNPGFTGEQRVLYECFLLHSSELIIQFVKMLPFFEKDVLMQLVTTNESIVNLCEQVLEKQATINARFTDDQSLHAEFERQYISMLSDAMDNIQLFGLDENYKSVRRFSLTESYIELALVPSNSPEFVAPTSGADIEKLILDRDLEQGLRLAVTGKAGSGKTTLMQWIVVRAATEEFRKNAENVPFYIRLREYRPAERALPSFNEFVKSFDKNMGDICPENWTRTVLESGRGIILIDGVDEFPMDRMDEFSCWLDSLDRLFPKSAIVITSRSFGAISKTLESHRYSNCHLAEMTRSAIWDFIGQWHKEVLKEDQSRSDDLQSKKRQLLDRVFSDRDIFRLCQTPLLCALVCAVNSQPDSQLPTSRKDLYKAAVNLLFNRESERGTHSPIPLTKDMREVVLADMSIWFLRGLLSEAKKDDVLSELRRSINTFKNMELSAEQLLDYFVVRVSILRMPDPETVDFTHRSFLEHFASDYLASRNAVTEVLSRIQDKHWADCAILVASKLNQDSADELVKGVLVLAEEKPKFVFLASQLAKVVLRFPEGSDTEEKVNRAVLESLPPETLQEASDIADSGDHMSQFLGYEDYYTHAQQEYCISALEKIGTISSLQTLTSYFRSPLPKIRISIFESASYANDLRTFAEIVLSELREMVFYRNHTVSYEVSDEIPPQIRIDETQTALWGYLPINYCFLASADTMIPGVPTSMTIFPLNPIEYELHLALADLQMTPKEIFDVVDTTDEASNLFRFLENIYELDFGSHLPAAAGRVSYRRNVFNELKHLLKGLSAGKVKFQDIEKFLIEESYELTDLHP